MQNISNTKGNISTSNKKVFVGMSGGVDSSVSAYLLKEQGFDVTGVFIKVWQPDETDCGWKDERRDAMRVAAALDIPFVTIDLSEVYKKEVADYMIKEYSLGRTPNPDIMCNRYVKFGSFWEYAKAHGAAYIATGHYAIRKQGKVVYEMHEGNDTNKDQTYFLWTLTERDLEHVLFPVGHLEKPKVREIAQKANLPVFKKKDSQGVCFIGHLDMKEFLKQYISTKEGLVLDIHGKTIGTHEGAILYTLGERHGFVVHNKSNNAKVKYVVSKDIEANTITVADDEEYKEVFDNESNLISRLESVTLASDVQGNEIRCEARIRYRQERQACTLQKNPDGSHSVTFDTPQKGMSKGQSAVFYSGTRCIGGGILM
ncbi:MAG: tRNA 2-thiouridine(34) synthase MnmA [Candidatus Taylorbacteria bacterium]|nr:tRNA 2-thiouridine(34) synthase MnmA [Candidatus Taylorbacteria bacterium]